MIELKPLTTVDLDGLQQLVQGYVSPARYRVSKMETEGQVILSMELEPLSEPYVKQFGPLEPGLVDHYSQLLQHGLSLGAYEAGQWVGVTLAETHAWNQSLWVWEFHVAASHQRRGIGQMMMERLAELGRAAGLRTIVCETQSTNVPAIQFYRRVGFAVEGIDLSYYSNDDFPDGEIAIFMKRRL